MEASLRPFLPVDKLSFAAQGDLVATWLPVRDAYARVEMKPLGLLLAKDNNPSYVGAYASAGYDQTYLGVAGIAEQDLYGGFSVGPLIGFHVEGRIAR